MRALFGFRVALIYILCSSRNQNWTNIESFYRRNVSKQYLQLTESDLESDALLKMKEKLRRRVVKSFIDILILAELKNESMSGYDVIGLIHEKHGILMSSGTVYSSLYSLERAGLIKGVQNQRKRVYALTDKGERNAQVVTNANKEIQSFIRNMSLLRG